MYKMNQLVSIGFPTYNGGPRIRRALNSLLAQSYKNFEIIISDNASEDNTQEVCQEYAEKDPRIKYFRRSRNVGPLENFEVVFKKAVGEYFMWAADDDWWSPDFIRILKDGLDSDESYGVAMSSLKLVYEDGESFGEVIFSGRNDLKKYSYGSVFNATVVKKPATHFFIYGLFRMGVLKKLLWQPIPAVFGPDKILICEAALFTRFYSVPDILWIRTVRRKETPQQYGPDYAVALTDKKAHMKHVWTAVTRLFSSPNIPLARKALFLPSWAIVLMWAEKKHILKELWPGVFRILKRTKKKVS